ncbi:bifunctional phosphoribosylaminoimidazolecarboxamide formyltransferase/IMP cyclohydrolase [bacterium]|nr:bifunctional phosphoribosylaminoimidazolecarboxamide formyltransferase/IMP cyclohydrolase [bacterium]MBT6832313.1 bifunctional phosphoribosylaminoimidazolecarboxamide formyltransferase/IMP cyclohydrolase [bacterium]MBT6996758.1 bifunctional phosphoribosylaminoimidazolecarboxamide formyltransferase/IMP cyclohydrolase [bacterium]MBT7772829.1 bifunctional phosphoribosylaminoimidazolecarboxamide formyltransferase/IMP cyclohydrolase [bacterium]
MKKTALLSVSDKTGIVEFAQELEKLDFQIISTGGTFRELEKSGVKNLLEVADFTGFPEGLEGRIKTLTPQVFGGILNLRNSDAHQKFCRENKIENIDLVVVNLYPFKKNYEDATKTFEEKVEQIDIGGPSMIRAAAKNFEFCAPVVDPEDYEKVVDELKTSGEISLGFRKILATKVFEMTAHYDLLIAKFWAENAEKMPLRYGENPHQSGVILNDPFSTGADLVAAEILNGKPMSYNNFQDASGALELAMSFDEPFVDIIKHASPCCAAMGKTIDDAWNRAWENGDQTSAFGGIIALNRKVTKNIAEKIVSFFNEIVLAPDFEDEALEILKTKKNLRVLRVPGFEKQTSDLAVKKIRGGTLVQDADIAMPNFGNLKVATEKKPTDSQWHDLETAWRIVKIVKSNAIVVVKNQALVGKGGGQTSRVDAMKIALEQAGKKSRGAVIASDAFFPFADAVEASGAAGIAAIIQPGGSIRDGEVFAKSDELGIATVLTGMRSFLH